MDTAALRAELLAHQEGRGDWERTDAATKRLLNAVGLTAWDLIGFVSDDSLHAWFDEISEPGQDDHGHVVYFISIEAEDLVKIGYTKNLRQRMAVLQSTTPHRLRLEAVMSGGIYEERELHMLFKADRVRGEWFRRSDRLDGLIRSLNARLPVVV